MEEHPAVGGDTAWVSGYGLYDELSPHMQKFLEGLHAVHTSRLQYDTLIVSSDLLFPFFGIKNILKITQ
jgi:sulfonate dioxygenase